MAPTHTKKTEIGQSAVRSMRLRRSPQPLSLQIYSPGRHKRRGGGVVIPLKGGAAAPPPAPPPKSATVCDDGVQNVRSLKM